MFFFILDCKIWMISANPIRSFGTLLTIRIIKDLAKLSSASSTLQKYILQRESVE